MSRKAVYRFEDQSVLKYMRIRTGLTMREVATVLNTTVTNVNRYEHRGVTKIKQLKKLAVLYRVPMDALARNNDISNVTRYLKTPTVRTNRTLARFKRSDVKKRDNGDAGELIVIENEQRRLAGTPYANGVNGNYCDDLTCGFDILSFTVNGEPLYIEVKTGEDGLESDFFMTENERQYAKYCYDNGKNYELHRVYNYTGKSWDIKIYTAADIIERGDFKPSVYRVKVED